MRYRPDAEPVVFPERLTLRDTKVFADEGQRIFTTATGYGYEKQEYVRADLVRPCAFNKDAPDCDETNCRCF